MNTNCLEGWKCPECGNEDKFLVEINSIALVMDDGITDYGDADWSEDSSAQCYRCDFSGEVYHFTEEA